MTAIQQWRIWQAIGGGPQLWSHTREDGALGESAARRKNCQLESRNVSSPSGISCLMAGTTGQRVKQEKPILAIETGAMIFVRLINRQADSP